MGGKGLTLGLSTLECYLANDKKDEAAAWPGDADLVLVDSNFTPYAIIEFKKHTPSNRSFSFDDQKLSNYYRWGEDNWSQDGRKYNRLATFQGLLEWQRTTTSYYCSLLSSSRPFIEQVQLECIEGADREVKNNRSRNLFRFPKASDVQSCRDFVVSLIGFIKS